MLGFFGDNNNKPSYRFSMNPCCKWCHQPVYYTEEWSTECYSWIYVAGSLHYNKDLAERKYRDLVETVSI